MAPLPFFSISSSVNTQVGCSYDGRVLCYGFLALVAEADSSSLRSSAFCCSAILNRSIFSRSPDCVFAWLALSDSYSLVVWINYSLKMVKSSSLFLAFSCQCFLASVSCLARCFSCLLSALSLLSSSCMALTSSGTPVLVGLLPCLSRVAWKLIIDWC